MPDGTGGGKAQTVIYQCAEDDVADTIKPRLMAAGADCDKVAYIIDENNELTFEDSRIEEVLSQTGARLLVIDPIQAFLVQDSDMQSAARMRNALSKLADVASRYQCAVVLVGHLNKSYGGKNLYRGLGSIDIAAIARDITDSIPKIAFLVHDPSLTVFLCSNGNVDCGKLVKENASIYNGKGGGNKSLARAIFAKEEYIPTFIDLIEKHLR